MEKKSDITVSQLFIILFISRSLTSLTYSPALSFGNNIWDYTVSAIVSFFVVFLMLIPIYYLHKSDTSTNLVQKYLSATGKLGIVISIIYAFYYLYVCCYTVSNFNIFVSNVMNPRISIWLISFTVAGVACYGANKGIEGLARTAGILLFMIVAAIVFLICALFTKIDTLNYTPLMYNGPTDAINGTVMMLAQNFCLSAVAMLLPFTKGNIKKGVFFWNFFVHILFIIFIFLIVGTLGDYLKTQMFPLYSAASIAEIGTLKRLDGIYLGIWTTGLFCKVALFLYLCGSVFKSVFGEKAGKILLYFSAFSVAVVSAVISSNISTSKLFFNLLCLFSFTIILNFLLPLLLLIVSKVRKGTQNPKDYSEDTKAQQSFVRTLKI